MSDCLYKPLHYLERSHWPLRGPILPKQEVWVVMCMFYKNGCLKRRILGFLGLRFVHLRCQNSSKKSYPFLKKSIRFFGGVFSLWNSNSLDKIKGFGTQRGSFWGIFRFQKGTYSLSVHCSALYFYTYVYMCYLFLY